MTAPYHFKDDRTKLLRMLHASIAMKKKKGWSRDTGCGFIAKDVKEYRLNKDKTVDIIFTFSDGRWSKFSMWSLNLREAEELLKYAEKEECCPLLISDICRETKVFCNIKIIGFKNCNIYKNSIGTETCPHCGESLEEKQ